MSQLIDYQLLDELGLGSIPADERDLMIDDIKRNLSERLGLRAESLLSEEKLNEFDQLLETDPKADDISAWLQTNMSNYQQVIEEELSKIKDEIRPQVPQILSDIEAGVPNPNA